MSFSLKKLTISDTLKEPYSSPFSLAAISLVNFNSLIFVAVLFSIIYQLTSIKKSWSEVIYYYSKFSNVRKFNLDYETFFLEFKDKLLSE